MNRLDWLEDQLDSDSLSSELRAKYEVEASKIAKSITQRQNKEKLQVQQENERRAMLKAQLQGSEATIDSIIATVGEEEFGEDYDISKEGDEYVLYSRVARDNQDHRRPHSTEEAAKKDRRYLIYNRLYDRYVRGDEHAAITSIAG